MPQGDAIYRVLNDTLGPDQILGTLLNSAVAGVTLVVMIAIMLSRNVPLTIFALSVAPLLVVTNNYFGKRIKTGSVELKQRDTRLTTMVQRAMTAVGLVQAFNRQKAEYDGFHAAAGDSARSTLKLDFERCLFGLAINTVYTLGGAIIFGYGGYLVYRDTFAHPVPNGVTCGDLMVFMAYLGSLWDPLRTLTSTKAELQNGIAGAERVFEVLDHTPAVVDNGQPLPVRPRELSLDGVRFGYLPGKAVLKNVLGPDRAGADGRLRRAERGGQEHAAAASAAVLWTRVRAQCGWTTSTCETSRSPDVPPAHRGGPAGEPAAPRDGGPRTLPTAGPMPRSTTSAPPPNSPAPTTSLPSCPTDTTRCSPKGAATCRAVSGNGWRSPARW